MKMIKSSNRGATLIELISSVAILAIIGLSCFTLLMFSIRTNQFIFSSNSACRDAEVLNDRLEFLLRDATVLIDTSNEDYICIILCDSEENLAENDIVWYRNSLELRQDADVLQDKIDDFSAEIIDGTNLVCIKYTIDDAYECSKIIPIAGVFEESVPQ